MINDIRRSPFAGIGKPEPLRGDLAGWWSRRITADHRIVYRIRGSGDEQRLEIVARRYHYSPPPLTRLTWRVKPRPEQKHPRAPAAPRR